MSQCFITTLEGGHSQIFINIFLAGQLVFVHRWLTCPLEDSAVALEATVMGSFEALTHLVHRGPHL